MRPGPAVHAEATAHLRDLLVATLTGALAAAGAGVRASEPVAS
jgi:hypothetical protein